MKVKLLLFFSCVFLLFAGSSCAQSDKYDEYVNTCDEFGIHSIFIIKSCPLTYPSILVAKKSAIKDILVKIDILNMDFKNQIELTEEEYYEMMTDSLDLCVYGLFGEIYTLHITDDGTIYQETEKSRFSESISIDYTDKGSIEVKDLLNYLDEKYWHGVEPWSPLSSYRDPNVVDPIVIQ